MYIDVHVLMCVSVHVCKSGAIKLNAKSTLEKIHISRRKNGYKSCQPCGLLHVLAKFYIRFIVAGKPREKNTNKHVVRFGIGWKMSASVCGIEKKYSRGCYSYSSYINNDVKAKWIGTSLGK